MTFPIQFLTHLPTVQDSLAASTMFQLASLISVDKSRPIVNRKGGKLFGMNLVNSSTVGAESFLQVLNEQTFQNRDETVRTSRLQWSVVILINKQVNS